MATWLTEKLKSITFGKAVGLLVGATAALVILMICLHEDDLISGLWALLGACLGWLTGILVVPLSQKEEVSFSALAKIISGFVTGYLLGKIDPLVNDLLKPDSHGNLPIADPMIASRALLAVASYLVALLNVFCARSYWSAAGGKVAVDTTASAGTDVKAV